MARNVASFFDITLRNHVDAQLRNGGSDSFFLFSGPPSFIRLASKPDSLCPLLFTNSFNDPDGRPGDMPVGSFGTSKVVMANSGSNPGPRSLQIGSAPLVTSHPFGADTSSKWNFLKRLFYWLIVKEDKDIKDALLMPYIGSSGRLEPVAPSINDLFLNFSRSSFYKIPFGIFALALTKNMESLSVTYYEGCTLQDVGGQLTAGMGMPIQLTGSSGAAITYIKPVRLTDAEVSGIVSYNATGSDAAAMLAAIAKITSSRGVGLTEVKV
jgi:hypothetical protein